MSLRIVILKQIEDSAGSMLELHLDKNIGATQNVGGNLHKVIPPESSIFQHFTFVPHRPNCYVTNHKVPMDTFIQTLVQLRTCKWDMLSTNAFSIGNEVHKTFYFESYVKDFEDSNSNISYNSNPVSVASTPVATPAQSSPFSSLPPARVPAIISPPAPSPAPTSLPVVIPVPPEKRGYMRKQGQQFKSWKNRFFYLNRGVLTYFNSESEATSSGLNIHVGESLPLGGYKITFPQKARMLLVGPGSARNLNLDISDSSDFTSWQRALELHIAYIDAVQHQASLPPPRQASAPMSPPQVAIVASTSFVEEPARLQPPIASAANKDPVPLPARSQPDVFSNDGASHKSRHTPQPPPRASADVASTVPFVPSGSLQDRWSESTTADKPLNNALAATSIKVEPKPEAVSGASSLGSHSGIVRAASATYTIGGSRLNEPAHSVDKAGVQTDEMADASNKVTEKESASVQLASPSLVLVADSAPIVVTDPLNALPSGTASEEPAVGPVPPRDVPCEASPTSGPSSAVKAADTDSPGRTTLTGASKASQYLSKLQVSNSSGKSSVAASSQRNVDGSTLNRRPSYKDFLAEGQTTESAPALERRPSFKEIMNVTAADSSGGSPDSSRRPSFGARSTTPTSRSAGAIIGSVPSSQSPYASQYGKDAEPAEPSSVASLSVESQSAKNNIKKLELRGPTAIIGMKPPAVSSTATLFEVASNTTANNEAAAATPKDIQEPSMLESRVIMKTSRQNRYIKKFEGDNAEEDDHSLPAGPTMHEESMAPKELLLGDSDNHNSRNTSSSVPMKAGHLQGSKTLSIEVSPATPEPPAAVSQPIIDAHPIAASPLVPGASPNLSASNSAVDTATEGSTKTPSKFSLSNLKPRSATSAKQAAASTPGGHLDSRNADHFRKLLEEEDKEKKKREDDLARGDPDAHRRQQEAAVIEQDHNNAKKAHYARLGATFQTGSFRK